MYSAIYMVKWGNRYLERETRIGGYQSLARAERAVLKKGNGYVRHYESGTIVSAVSQGRLIRP